MAEPISHDHPVGTRHVTGPAAWALRTYWGTTVLLVGTTAAALGAVLPAASLLRLAPSGAAPRLHPWTLGHPSYGSLWDANAQTPAILQQIAVNVALELLVAAGVAVLAVAGLTVLTLFAARAAQRAREVAVRRAVGASHRSLLTAALFEGAVILALGLVIGGGVGTIGGRVALDTWPGAADPPRWGANGIVVIALGATVLAGALLSALVAPRRRLAERAPRPVPLALPAIQLGLSLLVLAVGAHLTRHSARPMPSARTPGAGEVGATSAEARPAERAAMYAALLQRLSHRPEFDSVSLTSPGAVAGLGTVAVVTTLCGFCAEGGIHAPWHYESAAHEFVSADSFKALGVHVLAGRGITTADRWDSPRVAVVSRGLARRHFQNGEAIGRRIKLGDDPEEWHTVVGVVDDVPGSGLGAALEPPFKVYSSVLRHPAPSVELLVRPPAGGNVEAGIVLQALAESLGAAVPIHRVSEAGLLAAQVAPIAWFGRWLGLEGWTMLAVATTGTFALLRLWVLSLLTDLGVRRAVGARRRRILALVLGRAAGVGAAGTLVGLWFAPSVWDAIGTAIPGLPAWDSGLVALLAALLLGVSLAGAFLPAWQAIRMTPAALLTFAGD